ncbi:MAG TPA: 16S rRNA (cytidine(1402)-2'-O)-methyltransferase [Vicinamibacterales bacterium]|nr:16S rRNA (cytidine(1402)-2'-O)-methyltransferase [Vicinamibacterales bacterium]
MAGTLFVVATPIGNLDDITIRALRVLREVDLIAAEDTRHTAHLLLRHGITTPTTSLHEHNEATKAGAIVARLVAGERVALVSDAGTPTIADPGVGLVRAALEAGVRVEPIPGPNAAVAMLSASGLLTDSFTFLGFPPTKPSARKRWFSVLATTPGVAVFYESPHRIRSTIGEITEKIGDKFGVIGREVTKTHEQLVRGPISTLVNSLASGKGEFTIAVEIGHIAEFEIAGPADLARSRRKMIATLADAMGLSANDLYAAVEKVRK